MTKIEKKNKVILLEKRLKKYEEKDLSQDKKLEPCVRIRVITVIFF
jgi:hypothetical protein